MGSRLKLRHLFFFGALAGVFIIPLFFQNCAEPLDESRDASSVAKRLEFAYDANIDHLAYMSCSFVPGNPDPNSFFTFKAGAYKNGNGLKLTNEFFNSTRNLLSSVKIKALQESPVNSGVYASLSLRENAQLQTVTTSTGENSISAFVGSLTSSAIATPLVKESQTQRVNVFDSSKFEGTIHLKKNETIASTIRNKLNIYSTLLSVGFGQNGQQAGYGLSPVENSGTQIYGLGYLMNFTVGHGLSGNFLSGDARIMTNLREYNMLNGQQTSSIWDCSANWRFIIVRPQDLGRAPCTNFATEPTPTTAADIEKLAALRTVLPASTWGVNLQQRCIVQKSGLDVCYGSDPTNQLVINYNGGGCIPGDRSCPHYLTICKKR